MPPMKANNWRMPPASRRDPTGGGGQGPSPTRKSKFSKPVVMQPMAVIHSQKRAKEKQDEINVYLNPEPPAEYHDSSELFEAQHIIAGTHLVPLGLDRPEVFDAIRIKNMTWVRFDGGCVIALKSKNPLHLKQACQDLYALIRDLRLTSERPAPRFIIQRPSPWLQEGEQACISLVTGSRPEIFHDEKPTKTCIVPVVDDLIPKTAAHFMPIAMSLTGLNKDLQMRVSFGHLNLLKKQRSVGEETTYDRLPKIMKAYVNRGTATLGSRLPIEDFPQIPEVRELLRNLTKPETGIRTIRMPAQKTDLVIKHELVITLRGEPGTANCREIRADMSNRRLGEPRMKVIETFPTLDWTVLAPDRKFDWNMRINTIDRDTIVPDDFQILCSKTLARSIENQERNVFKVRTLELPPLTEELESRLDEQIKDVQIKTIAQIEFEDAPYGVEVNVTQTRPGIKMTKPGVSWGVDFYGSQWEESLNNASPDGLRKDWGRGLVNMWPNSKLHLKKNGVKGKNTEQDKNDGMETFETRFGHQLSCILKAQAALEGLKIEELSNALI